MSSSEATEIEEKPLLPSSGPTNWAEAQHPWRTRSALNNLYAAVKLLLLHQVDAVIPRLLAISFASGGRLEVWFNKRLTVPNCAVASRSNQTNEST